MELYLILILSSSRVLLQFSFNYNCPVLHLQTFLALLHVHYPTHQNRHLYRYSHLEIDGLIQQSTAFSCAFLQMEAEKLNLPQNAFCWHKRRHISSHRNMLFTVG